MPLSSPTGQDALGVQVVGKVAQGGLASRAGGGNDRSEAFGELIRVLRDGGPERRTALPCPPQRLGAIRVPELHPAGLGSL